MDLIVHAKMLLIVVDCAEGTYYKSGLCEPCPVGQYQDQPKQTTCKSCTNDFTTESVGTVSADLCYSKTPILINSTNCILSYITFGFFSEL